MELIGTFNKQINVYGVYCNGIRRNKHIFRLQRFNLIYILREGAHHQIHIIYLFLFWFTAWFQLLFSEYSIQHNFFYLEHNQGPGGNGGVSGGRIAVVLFPAEYLPLYFIILFVE